MYATAVIFLFSNEKEQKKVLVLYRQQSKRISQQKGDRSVPAFTETPVPGRGHAIVLLSISHANDIGFLMILFLLNSLFGKKKPDRLAKSVLLTVITDLHSVGEGSCKLLSCTEFIRQNLPYKARLKPFSIAKTKR